MTPRARGKYRPSFGVAGEFLDYLDEQEAAADAAAEKRAAGDFGPYYVRRPEPWGSGIFWRFKWAIFYGSSDMNSVAPEYYKIGYFWSFKRACAIALRLQEARKGKCVGRREKE